MNFNALESLLTEESTVEQVLGSTNDMASALRIQNVKVQEWLNVERIEVMLQLIT
jgi:hypothetical protein